MYSKCTQILKIDRSEQYASFLLCIYRPQGPLSSSQVEITRLNRCHAWMCCLSNAKEEYEPEGKKCQFANFPEVGHPSLTIPHSTPLSEKKTFPPLKAF